jgi:hypothetical protein
MKNICDSFVDFFKNEDIKRDVKKIIRPIGSMLYNELYIYIWFICIYHVFFIFIVLINLYLLSKLLFNVEKLRISRIVQMHSDNYVYG